MLEALYPGASTSASGARRAATRSPRRPCPIPSNQRHPAVPQQVIDLIGHLSGELDDSHIFSGIQAGPVPTGMPDVWLLGSRYESAYMAAHLGLPSLTPTSSASGGGGPTIVEGYRKNFHPSKYLSEPKVNIGVQVLCADTRRRPFAWPPAVTWPG